MTVAPPATETPAPTRTPEPFRLTPPPSRDRIALRIVLFGFLAVSLYALYDIGVNPLTLWYERDDIGNLLERMWPPRIDDPASVWSAALETFFMAFLGTVLGFALAVPVAFAAAQNVNGNRATRWLARALIVSTRAVPELIFALILVRAYSIGVLAGIIALGVHSVGMLGKLFADSIEQIDEGQREGVIATGASRLQQTVTGVVPQIVPAFIAITLYRLDINFRSATLLGLVGAGGIGLQVRAHQGSLDYEQLLGVTLVIIALIVVVEVVATGVRSIILGHERTRVGFFEKLRGGPPAEAYRPAAADAPAPLAASTVSEAPLAASAPAAVAHTPNGHRPPRVTGPEPVDVDSMPLSPPWTKERTTMYVFGGACVVLTAMSFVVTGVSVIEFFAGLPDIPRIVVRLIPTSMDWWQPMFGDQLIETVLMGFAATFLALLFAVPTGFLAARNVAPARWVYVVARYLILLLRALPELIVAVILVAALGLGPKPGVLALAIGLYAFASKLFADSIEEVSEAPRDGIRAVGADRMQESTSGVLSQAMPAIVGNSLYLLDISIRSSTVLGIVGAGGIGFAIIGGARLLDFELVGGLLIIIFVIVYAIELLSNWVRSRLL